METTSKRGNEMESKQDNQKQGETKRSKYGFLLYKIVRNGKVYWVSIPD